MLFVILGSDYGVRALEHGALSCVTVRDGTCLQANKTIHNINTNFCLHNQNYYCRFLKSISKEMCCYLGGMDFMLLSGSSKTLGQASGVTEI